MCVAIAFYLSNNFVMVFQIFYRETLQNHLISTTITNGFLTFYLLNIGVLIGCLANTLGAESRGVAKPLNNDIYEDVRNLLAKYQTFKAWII